MHTFSRQCLHAGSATCFPTLFESELRTAPVSVLDLEQNRRLEFPGVGAKRSINTRFTSEPHDRKLLNPYAGQHHSDVLYLSKRCQIAEYHVCHRLSRRKSSLILVQSKKDLRLTSPGSKLSSLFAPSCLIGHRQLNDCGTFGLVLDIHNMLLLDDTLGGSRRT